MVGVDVEPDMLEHARQAARDANVCNVRWMLGADTDIPALRRVLGDRSVAAVTIAQAPHWMNHQDLFRAAAPLLRPGAVSRSSPAGRRCGYRKPAGPGRCVIALSSGWATTLTDACGTDEQSQQRYRDDLAAAGFDVFTTAVDYVASLDLDHLVGGVYSAMGSRIPAASQRPALPSRSGL